MTQTLNSFCHTFQYSLVSCTPSHLSTDFRPFGCTHRQWSPPMTSIVLAWLSSTTRSLSKSNIKRKSIIKINRNLCYITIILAVNFYAKAKDPSNSDSNNFEYVVENGEWCGQKRSIVVLVDESIALIFPYLVGLALNLLICVTLILKEY